MIARTQISPNGPELSSIAYGTWRLMSDGASAQEINRRLNLCLELGLTTIDAAEIYGGYRVEALLGEALGLSPGLMDKLEIITKAGIYIPNAAQPERRVAMYDAGADRIAASVDASLRHMGLDSLDLFLVHRPDWLTSIDDTASGLDGILASGKAKSVGVSNYSASQFEALNDRMDGRLVTNQVEFSLLHMDPIFDGTFDQCQRLSLKPYAWSPLGGGQLFSPDDPMSQRLQAEAAVLSEKYGGATLDQLAFAWVMAHPSGPVPVIGTNRDGRIRDAAAAAGIKLDRQDWYALWTAAKGHGIP
jgi:predicted oxidoreductase